MIRVRQARPVDCPGIARVQVDSYRTAYAGLFPEDYLAQFSYEEQAQEWQARIDPHLLEHLLIGEQRRQLFRPLHLLLVVWLLSVIAAAGPSWRQEESPFLSDEAALLVLLKVSETMETTDVQPSRLERAKQKIRDLMEIRQGGAAGLIVYSGSAHLVMPVTRDERIISSMLEAVGTGLMPVDGDVLGEALNLGVQMVQQSGLPGSLLVIADSTSETVTEKTSLPVQILAVQPFAREADAGLQQAAKSLGGRLVRLTVQEPPSGACRVWCATSPGRSSGASTSASACCPTARRTSA